MPYQYLFNTVLAEALADFLAEAKAEGFAAAHELIPIDPQAAGRIAAAPVVARIHAPHYAACAMDGIAISADISHGASDTTPVRLKKGGYVWVDTGDPLPAGRDAVVMVEDVVEEDEEGTVSLYAAAVPWQHIRQIGEDINAGEMILPMNTRLNPAGIGAMLAAGLTEIEVYQPLSVGIIPTGDEIVNPKADPKSGEIINFNTPVFAAMIEQWGAKARAYPIVPDNFAAITAMLEKAAAENDVVLLNAGSSAGKEDYSAKAIAKVGRICYHGLAIRPGKPTILGFINHKPVIGVPGYPVSAIITLREIVHPLLAAAYGMVVEKEEEAEAYLARPIISSLKYEEFIRLKLGQVGDKLIAIPLKRGAGVINSLVQMDALLRVPLDSEGHEAGEIVRVNLMKSRAQISNTLAIIGSHDPLLDVTANLLRRHYPGSYLASSHVGSMGGLLAIKRGEAHLAGTHLLDEHDGSYNIGYIRSLFPLGGVTLIRGVKRMQGLMVAKGNPLGIKGIADLTRPGLRYVNRQGGAGTRILLDFLLKEASIDPAAVYGYEREEYTHIAVATQIVTGNADVGMGIYAAAVTAGLDFLPVTEEEYDFLLAEEYLSLPLVQQFLEILSGAEFAAACAILGGYDTAGAGTIK